MENMAVGVGIEHKTEQEIIVRAEYRYNNIISNQEKKIIYTQRNKKIKKDNIVTYGLEALIGHEINIGLSYYF
ncbi:hypothetical protein [Bartonella sp. DGB1]|uniref:hypothetical protein n=1 Tax=Bartonella sp. DGB1 TaxID=3239807 RepID=UPI0035268AC3